MTTQATQPEQLVQRPRALALRACAVGLGLILVGGTLVALLSTLYGRHASLPATVTTVLEVTAAHLAGPTLKARALESPRPLTLPNKLCRNDCSSTFKRYTAPMPALTADSAVYLPFFDGAVAVYLDDVLVAQSASLAEPLQDTTYRPTLFQLPNIDAREVSVIVSSVTSSGGRLGVFHIGPRADLEPAYRLASLLLIDLSEILLGVLIVIAGIATLLFIIGDRDRVYLWFLTLVAFVALRLTDTVLPTWPEQTHSRHLLYLLSTLGVVLASAGFVSRLANRAASRIDIGLLALWLPMAALTALALRVDFNGYWLLANEVIGAIVVVVGGFTLVRFLQHSYQQSIAAQASVTALLTLSLGLMLHDVGLAQIRPPLDFPLSNLAAAPMIAAFSIALAGRYGALLSRANRSNAELQSAVEHTRAELAERFEDLRERDRLATVQRERHRLLQDVHDGVGGRLAALALKMSKDQEIDPALSRELDASVADLRLVIDSLDTAPGEDLGVLIASMRERCEPWLALHDLQSTWALNASGITLAPDQDALSLCRIIQEALNNVVRHAVNASEVIITTELADGRLNVTVQDNGTYEQPQRTGGRGLTIMQRRAESLGAQLDIEFAHDGTTVTLKAPVRRMDP